MPKNYQCTLNAFRRKLHGLIPKELDDFDPSIILGKIEHGEKVLILDSNKDLPENWKDIQLSEYLPDNPGEDCVEENINPSDAGISEDSLSSDGAELPPLSGHQYFKMKDLMQSHFHSHVLEPGPVSGIKTGSIWAFKTKDGWTRARVFKKDEAKITLLLGDIGELAEANSEDLHHLPSSFQNEDFFSFRMKIPDGDWSREVEKADEYLYQNSIIVEVRKPVYYADLSYILLDQEQRKKPLHSQRKYLIQE